MPPQLDYSKEWLVHVQDVEIRLACQPEKPSLIMARYPAGGGGYFYVFEVYTPTLAHHKALLMMKKNAVIRVAPTKPLPPPPGFEGQTIPVNIKSYAATITRPDVKHDYRIKVQNPADYRIGWAFKTDFIPGMGISRATGVLGAGAESDHIVVVVVREEDEVVEDFTLTVEWVRAPDIDNEYFHRKWSQALKRGETVFRKEIMIRPLDAEPASYVLEM